MTQPVVREPEAERARQPVQEAAVLDRAGPTTAARVGKVGAHQVQAAPPERVEEQAAPGNQGADMAVEVRRALAEDKQAELAAPERLSTQALAASKGRAARPPRRAACPISARAAA